MKYVKRLSALHMSTNVMKTENDMKIMETDPNAAVTGCKFRPQNRIPMNADRSAVICVVFLRKKGVDVAFSN